jgi:hypothetical protein
MQDFNLFSKFLSYQRLSSYKSKAVDPVALYKWNIALSEALYPLLNTVEIALRNSLHTAIADKINDNNWLVNMNQQIIDLLHYHWLVKIESNIKEMSMKNKLDEGHLIAGMPFGFWTVLLSKKFEQKQFLWPRLKQKIFPFAHGIKINEIRDSFSSIRHLRNRIFHYEAIWHWHDLLEQHNAIVRAIAWMDTLQMSI